MTVTRTSKEGSETVIDRDSHSARKRQQLRPKQKRDKGGTRQRQIEIKIFAHKEDSDSGENGGKNIHR